MANLPQEVIFMLISGWDWDEAMRVRTEELREDARKEVEKEVERQLEKVRKQTMKQAMKQGKAEGMAQGKETQALLTAQALKAMGRLSIDEIAQATGLSANKVARL
jgi:flagellar biosynthesis/type III secretory pathway protein FliH